MRGAYETYEWHETPYGEFRVEKKRFGTWTSYSKDGTPLITGLTREAVTQGTPFHLEGVATNWANCRTSDPYDGTVGGKL
mgnify:FL=1